MRDQFAQVAGKNPARIKLLPMRLGAPSMRAQVRHDHAEALAGNPLARGRT